jgi:signal peptidase I
MNRHRFTALSRRLLEPIRWCVMALLVAGLVDTWLIDGLVIPYRVVGGSMAEALLGMHRSAVCGDCGYCFTCGTDVLPVAARAVCPNCGYMDNDLQAIPDVAGDSVLIDRAAFSHRAPQRWKVVAFRRPTQADQLSVKRVVGLPGESVEIRHGDVYVDERIQRKNLFQQRALAVLVHDADFQPSRNPASQSRWRADRSDSRWHGSGGRFTCDREAEGVKKRSSFSAETGIDWLTYHHGHSMASLGEGEGGKLDAGSTQFSESAVMDLCGYNQSQPRREEDVHPVTDLMLSFRLHRPPGSGALWIRISDGRDTFQTRLQFSVAGQHYQVFCNGKSIPGASGEVMPSGEELVEVSLIDQQFLLAFDGQPVLTWPYDRPDGPGSPQSSPVAIGSQGVGATVYGLRLLRDVYYTEPAGADTGRRHGRVHLAAGEYYVLGDNSPISDDSRTWPGSGAVDVKLLVGKPLVVIPSAVLQLWWGWHFQVPNPLQIRYSL